MHLQSDGTWGHTDMVSRTRGALAWKSKHSKREEAAIPLKGWARTEEHHFHCVWLVKAITVLALIQGQER